MTESDTYTVYISDKPADSAGLTYMYLCSDADIDYSNSAGGTTTGILGQAPTSAIYVDNSSGAIGTISISGTRANPIHTNTSETTQLSNEAFFNKLIEMYTLTQMLNKAYILRLYKINGNAGYVEMNIHNIDFTFSNDDENPHDAEITLSAYRRNRDKGFGSA